MHQDGIERKRFFVIVFFRQAQKLSAIVGRNFGEAFDRDMQLVNDIGAAGGDRFGGEIAKFKAGDRQLGLFVAHRAQKGVKRRAGTVAARAVG